MNRKNRKLGFSLVEVVVASMLLSMVSVVFINITLSTNKILERSRRRLFAAELAQYVLENLRANLTQPDWDDPNSPIAVGVHPALEGTCGDDWVDLNAGDEFLDAGSSYFSSWSDFAYRYLGKWQYCVTQIATATCSDCRTVEVNVEWTE